MTFLEIRVPRIGFKILMRASNDIVSECSFFFRELMATQAGPAQRGRRDLL